MNLAHGGHLTHGHPLNFSGKIYKFVAYGVTQRHRAIDYDEIERLAREHKPKMIVAGASAYARIIDFPRIAKIAQDAGALFFVDMAHIAGLVAAGIHPSPVPHADFVSTTTHKTLRGPRGGLVLCREKYAKDLDRITFPGVQGGPLEHIIAAKAVCLKEAAEPEFRVYQKQVVVNASALASALAKHGFRIVTGGTDNHLFLVDMHSRGITGARRRTGSRARGHDREQECDPFRSSASDEGRRNSRGHSGCYHSRHARARDGKDRELDCGRAHSPGRLNYRTACPWRGCRCCCEIPSLRSPPRTSRNRSGITRSSSESLDATVLLLSQIAFQIPL